MWYAGQNGNRELSAEDRRWLSRIRPSLKGFVKIRERTKRAALVLAGNAINHVTSPPVQRVAHPFILPPTVLSSSPMAKKHAPAQQPRPTVTEQQLLSFLTSDARYPAPGYLPGMFRLSRSLGYVI